MSLFKEFKQFAMRGNIVDLAVGVVIGGAFQSIVTSLVNDIIMPFKFGAVSMSSKTNSTIVPFSITGKYKIFRKNSVTICFGKPYKINTDSLEEANNELMDKVKTLIIKNRKDNKNEK